MSLVVGSIVEGVVTGIARFGAFVELPGGITGLVHISEIADAYVKDVNDYLKKEDKVRVKVIEIEEGKIKLSIKQADPNYEERKRRGKGEQPGGPNLSFEEKLARFLKESDERQQDLKRHFVSKRGGRGGYRF
ncbi:S1 RNA-binding domain-containing protein [Calderihabitans maritimus]|uniref:RNA binding S1 n=1 Tax=Calderihabitans maritimus TaxID=1246530 RepID=A0A1Z5HRT7_9FIRM|nr:S1 RNA-binding domain-containing protein [Calderihabitans maritimus]GAW92236.1 RNA binding S1 [Calderihabitans maritimus]